VTCGHSGPPQKDKTTEEWHFPVVFVQIDTMTALLSAGRPRSKGNHMLSIMTSPKPEQDTCVAPSINRAKS
jgi:hypothetical protein